MEIHSAVGAIIFSNEKIPRILMVKHKKFGVWFQPGGHLEKSENILEGTIREVLEETGIDLTDVLPKARIIDKKVKTIPSPKYILIENIPEYKDEQEHIHQDFLYVARVPFQKVKLSESEHHEIGWFTKKEFKNLELLDNTRKLYLEVFDSINKS